jgi:hypothetical protein
MFLNKFVLYNNKKATKYIIDKLKTDKQFKWNEVTQRISEGPKEKKIIYIYKTKTRGHRYIEPRRKVILFILERDFSGPMLT